MANQLQLDAEYYRRQAQIDRTEADRFYDAAASERSPAKRRRLNVHARMTRARADLWRALAEELDAYLAHPEGEAEPELAWDRLPL